MKNNEVYILLYCVTYTGCEVKRVFKTEEDAINSIKGKYLEKEKTEDEIRYYTEKYKYEYFLIIKKEVE